MSHAGLVVAAVIERGGRVLICRRRATDAHPLKWEFPGGKVQPGETPQAALRRELEEELGLKVRISEELARYSYCYPGRAPILLIFYRAEAPEHEPREDAFAEVRWERPERIPDYDLLEADRIFVSRLFKGFA